MPRREPQSSALSFMDCICCGFGAVLLLFILTAKRQVTLSAEDRQQAATAIATLQTAIEQATAQQQALDTQLTALDPKPDTNTTSIADLAAQQERLAQAIQSQQQALQSLEAQNEPESTASLDRPSANKQYLSGLQLNGPRIAILLENSGSMLANNTNDALAHLQSASGNTAEKWLRAKAAVRTILAAVPQGARVAIFQMNTQTTALSGNTQTPYIDPYNNSELLTTLERLDTLEANKGADLVRGLRTLQSLEQIPTSALLITDGLPTAPTASGALTEADRVQLFNLALATKLSFAINTILFPFEGDPSAAGLYWKLSTRTGGVTLVPDPDWPKL